MENWEFANSVSPKLLKFSEKTDMKTYFPVGSKYWMTTGFPSSDVAQTDPNPYEVFSTLI